MAGFYRHFIPNFADIRNPLNILTSDKVHFTWDEKCELAFNDLKVKLASKLVLAFPQLGEDFVVDVDASDTAFGGVLLQVGPGKQLHPVAYLSDSITPPQRSWAATTKEAFTLVLATRHWYVYLNSAHNPLIYLRTLKDCSENIGRWILELKEFDYTIKYVRGVDNVKADALSRNRNSENEPVSKFEEKIYSVIDDDKNFTEQLKTRSRTGPSPIHRELIR